MRKRISRIAPLQVGKVAAVFYAVFAIPMAAIMGIAGALAPVENAMPLGFVIAMPIGYVVFGFIFTALGAWLYNVIAKWTGGIEFETEEIADA